MKAKKFVYPVTIKEQHLDTFGHVNNATYLQLYEQARWEFVTAAGYDLNYIQKSGLGPTILEVTVKFQKEIGLRQEMFIESQVVSYERKVGKIQQQMNDASGQTYSEALFVIGLFDLNARKLVMPTEKWLSAIGLS